MQSNTNGLDNQERKALCSPYSTHCFEGTESHLLYAKYCKGSRPCVHVASLIQMKLRHVYPNFG